MAASSSLSRRDFLKLAGLASLSAFMAPLSKAKQTVGSPAEAKNILILVFDAWSAEHVSLYGYPRQTMPHLERFAENAVVYHRHYSAGTFTIPGTASLLTGTLPWTHRAFSLGSGVLPELEDRQAFALLANSHLTLGYAQNKYADVFLNQFHRSLDTHVSASAFNYEDRAFYRPWFENDPQIAFSAFDDNLVRDRDGYDASLFLGPLLRSLHLAERRADRSSHRLAYPLGLPETDAREYFSLGGVVEGAIRLLEGLQVPTFAYLHFYPPHDPYSPTKKFKGSFLGLNVWEPQEKPIHPLASLQKDFGDLLAKRHIYDDYLASWDEAVAKLFDFLRDSGLLETSYVFVTSDHGEMFERGELGHVTPLIYEPLIHIPLLVSRPGQKGREDIHAWTSSTDLLPTLAHLSGLQRPAWAEGQILPGLGGAEDPDRSLFTVEAARNPSFAPLSRASISLTKKQQRLTYYNYPDYRQFEFYDLAEDPQEMNDLYALQPAAARQMQDEMLQALAEADRPFQKE
jgi:arylsulfatase A-like enzyme